MADSGEFVEILGIGTEILTKDVMDQFLRSLGGIKTYYASKLSMALETYKEKHISVVLCEHEFQDGTIQSFINKIGGIDVSIPRYFVVASKEMSPELEALRKELHVDEVLLKPFNTEDIHALIKRALAKVAKAPEDWEKDLRIAREAEAGKRFQVADAFYKAMLKKYPGEPKLMLELADYYLRAGKLDVCEDLLEQIVVRDPAAVRAISLMGSLMKKKGNIKLAIQYLKDASTISPWNSQRATEIAECEIMVAEETLRKGIESDPYSSANHLILIKALTIRGQYTKAIRHIEMKMSFMRDEDKKEAEVYLAVCKKLSGLR